MSDYTIEEVQKIIQYCSPLNEQRYKLATQLLKMMKVAKQQPVSMSSKVQEWLDEFNDLNEGASGMPFFEARELGERLQAILDGEVKTHAQ